MWGGVYGWLGMEADICQEFGGVGVRGGELKRASLGGDGWRRGEG